MNAAEVCMGVIPALHTARIGNVPHSLGVISSYYVLLVAVLGLLKTLGY